MKAVLLSCVLLVFIHLYFLSGEADVHESRQKDRGSERWIVLDDGETPCDDVTKYASQDGWRVAVVVRETKYIEGCNPPQCLQMTLDVVSRQLSHFSTPFLLNSTSKLIGYLFAMENGAKIILDADCETPVADIAQSFRMDKLHQSGLRYSETGIFNPFHHWGWTDVFPKEEVLSKNWTDETNSDLFYITDWSSVPVRQAVMISGSTCIVKSDEKLDIKNEFPHGSPVSVGPPSLAPFSTGPTLFYEDAFLLLFTPPNLGLDGRQLYRTLLLNNLRSSYDFTSAFYYVNASRDQKLQCQHYKEAIISSNFTQSIYECSRAVSCSGGILDCYGNVNKKLMNCFVLHANQNFGSVFQAWSKDLDKLSIKLIIPEQKKTESKKVRSFYRFPKEAKLLSSFSQEMENIVFNSFHILCNLTFNSKWRASQKIRSPAIEDVVLIIVINYNFLYETVSYNEFVHRQYFKYIVYCVPSLSEFQNYTSRAGFSYVTSVEGLVDGWPFFYQCVSLTMRLGLPVRGYLQIGDDVLVNSWQLDSMPRDRMIMIPQERVVDLWQKVPEFPWVHWNSWQGQEAAQGAFHELANASGLSENQQRELYPEINITDFARTFIRNVYGNVGYHKVAFSGTDIFYVPEKLRHEYITATDLFVRHSCMVELALRIIFHGLQRPEEQRYYFKGRELWSNDRLYSWEMFDPFGETFIHPLKWMQEVQNKARDFICKTYLPLLDAEYHVSFSRLWQ